MVQKSPVLLLELLLAEIEKEGIFGAVGFICFFFIYFGNSNSTVRPGLFFVQHSSNSSCSALKKAESSGG